MGLTPKQLCQVMSILMKYVEHYGYDAIKFSKENGYYQKIWHKDRDLGGNPPHTWGELDEDMEELERLLKGDVATAYDLERLGAVLTAFGATMEWQEKGQKL